MSHVEEIWQIQESQEMNAELKVENIRTDDANSQKLSHIINLLIDIYSGFSPF